MNSFQQKVLDIVINNPRLTKRKIAAKVYGVDNRALCGRQKKAVKKALNLLVKEGRVSVFLGRYILRSQD